jgi:hypothetical protein
MGAAAKSEAKMASGYYSDSFHERNAKPPLQDWKMLIQKFRKD